MEKLLKAGKECNCGNAATRFVPYGKNRIEAVCDTCDKWERESGMHYWCISLNDYTEYILTEGKSDLFLARGRIIHPDKIRSNGGTSYS